MSEPCRDCGCALSDPDVETQTVEMPAEMGFQEQIRDYVLENGKLDGDSVFIQQVTICPESVEVEYQGR